MENRRGKGGNNDRFPLLGLSSHCRWLLQPWNQMIASWQESYDKPRQCVEKQRHHFANKGLYSQGYGLCSGHAWLWVPDCKESRVLKNWCFGTVLLEKTLVSPLDRKKIKPVNLKVNQPWILIENTDAEAPIFWPPDVKSWLTGKDPDAGKDWRQEKGATQDETAGRHHWCNGHELEPTPGAGEGQGDLVCCGPWSHRVGHDWATEQQHVKCIRSVKIRIPISLLSSIILKSYPLASVLSEDNWKKKKRKIRGFLGGSVVKNPPANAGDVGLIPDPGRPHKPQSNWAQAPKLLSLCPKACELQRLSPRALEPGLLNKRSHHDEKPQLSATREKSAQQPRPSTAKTKIKRHIPSFELATSFLTMRRLQMFGTFTPNSLTEPSRNTFLFHTPSSLRKFLFIL